MFHEISKKVPTLPSVVMETKGFSSVQSLGPQLGHIHITVTSFGQSEDIYLTQKNHITEVSCVLSLLQHDEGSNCGNIGSTGGKGRYLMFPEATDEVRENNDKLSPCSIQHISNILKLKKDECFVGEEGEIVKAKFVLCTSHCK